MDLAGGESESESESSESESLSSAAGWILGWMSQYRQPRARGEETRRWDPVVLVRILFLFEPVVCLVVRIFIHLLSSAPIQDELYKCTTRLTFFCSGLSSFHLTAMTLRISRYAISGFCLRN